jgi:polysaccharide pyruvyl transferase WcaK-like protein
MFGLSLDYTDLVAALLDLFIGRRGATVLLVPHVLGIGPDSESDLDACRAVNDRFRSRWPGRLHLFEEPFSHRETKHLIGACDFFVGSRMHACIAALSQCVPAVGLAYSRKFAGVMDAAGGGAVVVDLRAVDLPAAVARVDAAWLDRDRMREQLLARIPPIRASALGLLLRPEFSEFLGSAAP